MMMINGHLCASIWAIVWLLIDESETRPSQIRSRYQIKEQTRKERGGYLAYLSVYPKVSMYLAASTLKVA